MTSTDRAHTFHVPPGGPRVPPLHLIRRTWGDVAALLTSFDYTVCQAALYVDGGWRLQVADHFLADLATRRLRFVAQPRRENFGSAGDSTYRALKLMGRGQGWHATAQDFAEIARVRLMELGLDAKEASTLGGQWLRAPGEPDRQGSSGGGDPDACPVGPIVTHILDMDDQPLF